MKKIAIKAIELFDQATEMFINIPYTEIVIEHSLLSIAKWESIHHKSFLDSLANKKITSDEFIDYIRCMTLSKNISDEVYYGLSSENFDEINEYMNDTYTATWFRETNEKNNGKPRPITAELIYCWMINLQMPIEVFQKWHINRLITLIRVCKEENKASSGDNKGIDMNKRRALMAERRAKHKRH